MYTVPMGNVAGSGWTERELVRILSEGEMCATRLHRGGVRREVVAGRTRRSHVVIVGPFRLGRVAGVVLRAVGVQHALLPRVVDLPEVKLVSAQDLTLRPRGGASGAQVVARPVSCGPCEIGSG